ncbi:MAG: class I SAM-dependent methyltransferase [Terriglobia bacterium]
MLKTQAEKITFSFGRNWQDFVERRLNPEREQIATDSLKEFMEVEDLRGRSFLDIGCGSGLFSLGAYRLGARAITSIDVDPFSVRCCEELRRRAGEPPNWEIHEGSILDTAFLGSIPKADVVYAWGSLHHTGDMWQAIRNAASMVEKNGLFYLSIYNKVPGRMGSELWLHVKRLYNRSPRSGKRLMEFAHFGRHVVRKLASFENPRTLFTRYAADRGMDYWTDIRDWLGGYPYEFASTGEMFRFCTRELGFDLVNLHSTSTLGTNEFLFRRRD